MRQGLVSLYDPAAASLPDEQGCKSAFDRIGFDYLSEHLQKNCGRNDHAGLSWVGYFTQLRFWMAAAKQASDSAGVEPLQLYLTVDQSHGPCAGVCTRLLLHVEHRAWLGARAPCAMRMLLHGGPMTFTTAWLHDRLSDQSRIDDATATLKFLEHVILML